MPRAGRVTLVALMLPGPPTFKYDPDPQTSLRAVMSRDNASAVLRLAFHDAGTWNGATRTGGADGSILFELHQAANVGIQRGLEICAAAKALIDPLLRGVSKSNITWADLIQLGGAEAVAITGGPCIPVPIGRFDVQQADPSGQLPAATNTATQLVSLFTANNFTVEVSKPRGRRQLN